MKLSAKLKSAYAALTLGLLTSSFSVSAHPNCVESKFKVDAAQGWQVASANVTAGYLIQIEAGGSLWSYKKDIPAATSHAEGHSANPPWPEATINGFVLPSATVGTLLGRVGEDKSNIFIVGRKTALSAKVTGPLYLVMNDLEGAWGDNSGAITGTYRICPP